MHYYEISSLIITPDDARRRTNLGFGKDLCPKPEPEKDSSSIVLRMFASIFSTLLLSAGLSSALHKFRKELPPNLGLFLVSTIFGLASLLSASIFIIRPQKDTGYSMKFDDLARHMRIHNELVKDVELTIDNARAAGTAFIEDFQDVLASLECNRNNLLRALERCITLSDFYLTEVPLSADFDLSPTPHVPQPIDLPERQPIDLPEVTEPDPELVTIENTSDAAADASLEVPVEDIENIEDVPGDPEEIDAVDAGDMLAYAASDSADDDSAHDEVVAFIDDDDDDTTDLPFERIDDELPISQTPQSYAAKIATREEHDANAHRDRPSLEETPEILDEDMLEIEEDIVEEG